MRYAPDFSSRFRILKGGKISLVVSALLVGSSMTFASPTGGSVTSGSATINQNGSTTTINQSTDKASINWQSFNIAPSETVNFVQPSASSVTLNRVVGMNQSLIQGAMNANGQVILVNPNGVVFTEGATVNVGGLVATTKNITDENFQAGNYLFEGDSQASILNMGTITTANGGYVAMMAKSVENQGTITATLGRVELSGGNKFTLNLNGNSLLSLQIDEGTINTLVANGGVIKADGGVVHLTTQALNCILDGMVNNTGIIEAQSLNNQNGEIVLYAHGGTLNAGGTLDTGTGTGHVETSGEVFHSDNTLHVNSGNWLIDPVNIMIDSTLAGTIQTALGSGDVTISTAGSNTPSTASGESAGAGDITVNSAISWSSNSDLTLHADRNINVNADITATGASAKLTLEYGQGAVAASNTADYSIARGSKISLKDGQNFSTKLGSDGTSIDYTVINTASALQNMTVNSTSAFYALGSDIDLAGVTWTPVGDYTSYTSIFKGKFDGLGHTIDNLTISSSANHKGLFGMTRYATLKNITLDNVNINAGTGWYAGALVGEADYTSVYNSHSSGTVQGANSIGGLIGYVWGPNIVVQDSSSSVNVIATSSYIGGLIGAFDGGTLTRSYATGSVSGASYVGGLIGSSDGTYNATISKSYASGNVIGTGDYIGGLIGGTDGYNYALDISNVYALGNVSGANNIGGLIGSFYGYSNQSLSNAYATGAVTATGANKGGLFGRIEYSTTGISHAYWDATTTGQVVATGGSVAAVGTMPLMNAVAYTQSQYNGFDFTNDWFSVDGYTRPFLRMEWSPLITNSHQLQMMSMKLGSSNDVSYKLANDINLATSLTNNSEMWKDTTGGGTFQGNFVPVGNRQDKFYGSFDGQNHTIDNLYIYRTNAYDPNYAYDFVGLFGEVNAGTFKDITLSHANLSGHNSIGALMGSMIGAGTISGITISDGTISGHNQIGGIIGQNGYLGTISNVTVTNINIASDGDSVGGVIGYAAGMSIQNASASGAIFTANGLAGGLVGDMETAPASISNSHSSVNVTTTAGNYTGGLVGLMDDGSTITNSYATGSVSGAEYVGGLVGGTGSWGSATSITSSHATGNVTGSGNNIGGLVGLISSSGTISNSHSSSSVSGANNSNSKGIGGLVGRVNSGASITSSYSTGTVNGFDDVGGLVGINNGTISFSYSNANATSTATTSVDNGDVGGFVGKNTGVITTSYATGNITGALSADASYVGGFAGSNSGSGDISKSYATGTVTGKSAVGGFIGGNAAIITNSYSSSNVTCQSDGQGIGGFAGANGATISNSYSIGQVLVSGGTGTYIGGFVGYTTANATNSFWNFQTSGIGSDGSSNYGVIAKNTAEMKNLSTFDTSNGANWDIVTDSSLSNVYPQLRWATNGLGAGNSVWVIGGAAPSNGGSGSSAGGTNNSPTQTEQTVNDVVTSIVNDSITHSIPTLTQPQGETPSGFDHRVESTLVSVGSDKSLGNVGGDLNTIIRSVEPSVNTIAKEGKVTLVGETGGEGEIARVELKDIIAKSGGGELRVALSPERFIELVNGGMTLPDGISQEFYVVADKQ